LHSFIFDHHSRLWALYSFTNGSNLEIAPTKHGAGSIVVLTDWVIKVG
jgi:hypothetical protein